MESLIGDLKIGRLKMNRFDSDEFFVHHSTANDPSLSGFDGTAISSVTDITDGYVHHQHPLGSAELGGSIIFDENSFFDFRSESWSANTFSSNQYNSDPPSSNLTAGGESESLEVPELSSGSDSDMVFNYISRILMEENMDDKFDVYPEHPALLAAEKPFSDILGESFPPLPDQNSSPDAESPDDGASRQYVNSTGISANGVLASNGWPYDPLEYHQLQTIPAPLEYFSHSSQANGLGNVNGVLEESILFINDVVAQSDPAWQFQKGVEEARRFLPSHEKLVLDVAADGFHFPQEEKTSNEIKAAGNEPRGQKTHHDDDLDLQEGRSNKHQVFSPEGPLQSELDAVLLYNCQNCSPGNAEPETETGKNSRPKASKSRGKRQPKKEVVDLRTLLMHCAQSVAIDDRRSAYDQLKQIRQHSSPYGDANQRLAYSFADGLEARLAGTGSQVYQSIVAKGISTVDMLKAYRCFMSACPFKKIFYYYANATIMDVAKDAARLHIVDFGIYHGFQWPCFMQRLAARPGGPPRLKMTGIDKPMPGFRPTQRIDETGQRLADYAQRFGIPFEFHAIAAARWETVKAEDICTEEDEVLVVNGQYHFNSMMDETVIEDSPRSIVLKMIRRLNPAVYIFAIGNGGYNSPFFVTRFREVLFFYSSMFDLIGTTVQPEDEARLLIEKNILARDALNVIACEGPERVERPETYKQWQVRNLRAGFRQLPLHPEMMKIVREKLKAYHKDFVVDVDGQWLLQGWKGRILQALSTWRSRDSSS